MDNTQSWEQPVVERKGDKYAKLIGANNPGNWGANVRLENYGESFISRLTHMFGRVSSILHFNQKEGELFETALDELGEAYLRSTKKSTYLVSGYEKDFDTLQKLHEKLAPLHQEMIDLAALYEKLYSTQYQNDSTEIKKDLQKAIGEKGSHFLIVIQGLKEDIVNKRLLGIEPNARKQEEAQKHETDNGKKNPLEA